MRFPTDSTFAENYRIVAFVGQGGWADVYEAVQIPFERRVAIKILHAHLTAEPEKLERFRREARAASLLKHTNICQVYDFGTSAEGQPYLAMEFIDGSTLKDILDKRGKLPAAEALPIFIAICDALATAHEAKVLHRDIKPANIMIDKSGKPILLDFGIAKVSDDEASSSVARLTATGVQIGTPAYMSPEQCLCNPAEPRSDIYSLACVVYETLCGALPIQAESDLVLMHAQVHSEPKPLPRNLNLPGNIEQAIMGALSKSPEDRPANARAFARQLSGTEAPVAAPKRKQRPLMPALAAAVVLTAAIGGGGFWFMHHQQVAKPVISAEPTLAEYYAEAKHAFEKGDIKHGREFVEKMVASFQRDPSKADVSGLDNIVQSINTAAYKGDTQRGAESHGIKLLQGMINTLATSPNSNEAMLVHLQIALVDRYIAEDPYPDLFTGDYQYSPFVYKADTILSHLIPTLPDNRRDMATDVLGALLQKAHICTLNTHWKDTIELTKRCEKVYKQNGMTNSGRLQQALLYQGSAYALDDQVDKSAEVFARALKIYPGIHGIPAADQASVYFQAAQSYFFVGRLDLARDNANRCIELTRTLGTELTQRQLLHGLVRWGQFFGFAKEQLDYLRQLMRPLLVTKFPHPNKAVFNLAGRQVRDADVKSLPDPEQVQFLDVAASLITDNVAPLLSRFPKLEMLSLRINEIGNPTVKAAVKLAKLRMLDISCSYIDDNCLDDLSKAKSLRDLSLAYTTVTDAGMLKVAKIPSLAILNLRNSLIGDKGIENLAGAKKLRRIWLFENPLLHGAGLRKLPQLQELILAQPHSSWVDLSAVRAMHSLRQLELPAAPINDDSLPFLAELTNLEQVNLACTDIGDKTVSSLVKLPKLRSLNLNHTNITDQSIAMLAACKSLKELYIAQTNIHSLTPLLARKDLKIAAAPFPVSR